MIYSSDILPMHTGKRENAHEDAQEFINSLLFLMKANRLAESGIHRSVFHMVSVDVTQSF